MFFAHRWALSVLLLCCVTLSAPTDATVTAPHQMLDQFTSELYEQFRTTEDRLARHEIRQQIGRFVHGLRTKAGGRSRRDAFGHGAALLDSSAYTLSGFQEYGTIPINFPTDLCLFDINSVLYAAALHQPAANVLNQTYLSVFRNFGSSDALDLHQIFNYTVRSAQAMDCIGVGTVGYIALAYTEHGNHTDDNGTAPNAASPIVHGSPVFQLTAPAAGTNVTRIEVVQYFNELHLNRVYLMTLGPELYFVQSFATDPMRDHPAPSTNCLIYKWSGYHFDVLDELPCTNARQVQPFFVRSDMYMAIANYRDANGQLDAFSVIYKYSVEHSRFMLYQRLRSHAAVDIKYFELAEAGRIERFLVVANSFAQQSPGDGDGAAATNQSETPSIVYKYVNDFFVPFQSIRLYDVVQFLPILGPRGEFSLMIVCANQATQVWLYNGWNFEQSPVQFTGGALGSGVQRMRDYPLHGGGGTAIAVANAHMLRDTTNVYQPLYGVRQSGAFLSSSRDWCAEAMDEIGTQPLDRILAGVRHGPTGRDAAVQATGRLAFGRVSGAQLNVNALQSTRQRLDQGLADRLRVAAQTLRRMGGQAERLERAEVARSQTNGTDAGDSVAAGSESVAQTLAPQRRHFDELRVDTMTIGDTLNGRPIELLVHADRPLHVERLRAKRVYVRSRPLFDVLLAKSNLRDVQLGAAAGGAADNVDKLHIDALTVDGLINGLDLDTIAAFALRRVAADQQLVAQFNVNQLRAGAVIVDQQSVSGVPLADVIRIDADANVVNTVRQDVRFTQPVAMGELFVAERLNGLQVHDGQLDVLQRRRGRAATAADAEPQQRVTGHKRFQAVTLREPIALQGKLVDGGSLADMSPIVTVAEDIVLTGDYVLAGNATIRRALRARDVLGANGTWSVQRLLADGLRLDAGQVDNRVDFVQPIRVDQLSVDRVNGGDVRQWVRSGSGGGGAIQEITAAKHFAGDLRIAAGFCDALLVNGVPLPELNATVLKRTGDQTVAGAIRLQWLQVQKYSVAGERRLLGRPATDYLSRRDQRVDANVTIGGELLVHGPAQIQSLHSAGGLIDGFDVLAMLADTVLVGQAGAAQQITAERTEFWANVTVGRMQVDGSLFGVNASWPQLQAAWRQLEENATVEAVGPVRFEAGAVRVQDLLVGDLINGMPGRLFGHQWLVDTEEEQNFTAPQTVLGITSVDLRTADGRLNAVDVAEAHAQTVRLSDDVHVPSVQFDTVVFEAPLRVADRVAGLRFPDDLVRRSATGVQLLPGLQQIAGNLRVAGRLEVGRSANGVNVRRVCDLVATEVSQFPLQVLGAAAFASEPHVVLLNGANVERLLQTVWLTDEAAVLSSADEAFIAQAHIADAAGIQLGGRLNGKTAEYLRDKYVSVSRPQTIHSHWQLDNVLFEADLVAEAVWQQAPGMVRQLGQLANAVNLYEFCANALRNGVDQQITGQWEISEMVVHDNLYSRLNDLDTRTDFLRYSLAEQSISAPKHFEHAVVEHLAGSHSDVQLQGVNVADWVSRAVLAVGNNYTIQGTTVLDNPTVFGDVRVFGLVNNCTFSAEHILLKSRDQHIHGDVHIHNSQPSSSSSTGANGPQRRFRPLSIKEATFDYVNGIAVNEFLANIVPMGQAVTRTTAPLRFVRPPVVHHLRSGGQWNGVSVPDMVQQFHSTVAASDYTDRLGAVQRIGVELVENLRTRPRHLTAFRLAQSIDDLFMQQLITLRYSTGRNVRRTVYATIVQRPTATSDVHITDNMLTNADDPPADPTDASPASINFYRWHSDRSQLELDSHHQALRPVSKQLIDIATVRLYDRDYLIVETLDADATTTLTYLTYLRGQFRALFESRHNGTQNVLEIALAERSCIGFFSEYRATEVRIECAQFSDRGDMRLVLVATVPAVTDARLLQVVYTAESAELVALDASGAVHVWRRRRAADTVDGVAFGLVQSLQPLYMSRMISVRWHGDAMWLVTCAAMQQNSSNFGAIDVYRAPAPPADGDVVGRYEHVQRIALDVPVQVEIRTTAASQELVLYALTESHARPFVVYKYTGVTLFRQWFVASTLPIGRQFRVLGDGRTTPTSAIGTANATDVIAVLGAGWNVNVIEAVF